MTFFVDIGAYRLFVLLALLIGLTLLCYEVSFHRALIVMELSFLLIIPFTESVGLSIMDFVYHDDIMAQVDGIAMIKWQIYVFIMVLRLLFLMVTCRLLKNFKYDILAKDVAIVSFGFWCIICKHLWVFEFENARYIIIRFNYICTLRSFYCTIFVFQKCVLSPGAGAAGQNADCPVTTAVCLLSRKNERRRTGSLHLP